MLTGMNHEFEENAMSAQLQDRLLNDNLGMDPKCPISFASSVAHPAIPPPHYQAPNHYKVLFIYY